MLIDDVTITVQAGNGGDGAISFRREKYVPKGGPDGGDGGNGGNVCILASSSTHGLGQFKGKKHFKAESGERGGKALRHGKNGTDLILTVPPGTRVTQLVEAYQSEQASDAFKERLISDLTEEGQQIVIARGGKGGKGNWHYRSSTNQTPRQFEPGTKGEVKTLHFELQLLADVGLVGMPNAGKSTFLSVISNAKPKVADYPFTTLEPHLGTVFHRDQQFVVADIPGLIEGAAEGRGLGHEFLRHIQRTKTLVHMISATEEDPAAAYASVRGELERFDSSMLEKPEIVVLSKIDLLPDWATLHKDFIKEHKAVGLGATTNEGVTQLLDLILNQIKN